MERVGVLPGTEIGGYRVVAPLGRGGSGAVYRALDGDGRLVALKLLHPHLGADPVARERLRREVAHLQRIRHTAVARVLDAEIDQSDAFVVTELLDGEDLGAHVRTRGPLTADELADLAEQLRAALVVVHASGVLHRDLSPGNVLMTSRGPVLIDFGIAQAAEDVRVTSTGLVSGTPGFVPPELLEGGEPAASGDWWAWAAVLAFAATGRAPFGTRPPQAVLARALTGEADVGGLDRRTAAALRSALAPDPARRADAAHVVAELDAAAAGDVGPWPDDAPETEVVGGTLLMPATGVDDGAVDRTARLATVPDDLARGTADDSLDDAHHDDPYLVTYDDVLDQRGEDDLRAPADEEPHYGPDFDEAADGMPLPHAPRRTGTLASVAVLLVALGATHPGLALVLAVALAVLARTVGTATRAVQTRRARRGPRGGDTLGAVLLSPWYLLRGVVGVLPAALVTVSAVVLVGGLGWWALDGRLALVPPPPGEPAGELAGNVAWLTPALLGLAVLLGVLLLAFGPMSERTRLGARWTAHGVAPGAAGAAAVVLLALAGAAALAVVAASGTDTSWWPLPGAPDLR